MPEEPKPPQDQATAQQALKDVATQVAAGQRPTEIKLKDGRVIKASNTEELIAELVKKADNQDAHISRIEGENKGMREQLARLTTGLQSALGVNQTTAFDKNRYFELMSEDPNAAEQYRRQYDPEWQRMQKENMEYKMFTLGTIFLARHPEFSGEPADLRPVVEHLDKLGIPYSVDALDMAYSHLKTTGQIKVAEKPKEPTPPPNLGPSAAPITPAEQAIGDAILNAPNPAAAREIMRQKGLIPQS